MMLKCLSIPNVDFCSNAETLQNGVFATDPSCRPDTKRKKGVVRYYQAVSRFTFLLIAMRHISSRTDYQDAFDLVMLYYIKHLSKDALF